MARAFWLGYAAALLAIVAACSGCATAPSAPTAGARCAITLGGRAAVATVDGPAWGLWSVHTDHPAYPVAFVSADQLRCGSWS